MILLKLSLFSKGDDEWGGGEKSQKIDFMDKIAILHKPSHIF